MPRNDNADPGADPGPWGAPPPAPEPGTGPEPPREPAPTPGRARAQPGRQSRSPRNQARRNEPRRLDPSRLEAPIRRALDRLGREAHALFPAPLARRLPRALPGALVAVALAAWAASGLYQVGADQRAVVMRLGALAGLAGPGLHYHLPLPLGAARIVSVARSHETLVGSGSDGVGRERVLTGDGDLASIAFAVDWKLADPVAYLLDLRQPDGWVEALAETAVRRCAAQARFADLAGAGKAAVERCSAAIIQHGLDAARAGIAVTGVAIRSVGPPPGAAAAFDDIAQARQDAQAAREAALTANRKTLTDAAAAGATTVAAARAEEARAIARAQAAAARFEGAQAQYRADPASAEQRLYVDTLEAILAHSRKIIVDARGVSITPPAGAGPVQARPAATPADKAPGA